MLIADVRFPISDGVLVTGLRSGLSGKWGPLTVGTQLPATKTRRMVTVRDDSGPQENSVSRRRQGVNVWADSLVDAQNLALDAMAVCRLLPGGVIAATTTFSGPYEIEDDPQLTVGNKNLFHYYFVFTAHVKGNRPT